MRIFNPTLQSQRFDPMGNYIKEFVPELRTVPAKFIHAPYAMPAALQKELGCVIGKHYPRPIVDHRAASAEFKSHFSALKPRL
jgi:deoxyribodipyrimidine photo-lyase